jgi:hypothetical protein
LLFGAENTLFGRWTVEHNLPQKVAAICGFAFRDLRSRCDIFREQPKFEPGGGWGEVA